LEKMAEYVEDENLLDEYADTKEDLIVLLNEVEETAVILIRTMDSITKSPF